MSATLEILNTFSITTKGNTFSGKHGAITLSETDPFEITVAGDLHLVPGTLATATVVTVYDDDDDVPADWDYLFYWADQITYIQIIGPTMNVKFKVAAYQPFVLPGYDSIFAAADATPITGGTEPTMSDIDSVVLGNYTGTSANYLFAVID